MARTKIDESRTFEAGPVRIEIHAEPLEIDLDPIEVSKGPAEASARDIEQAIRSGRGRLASSTIAKRTSSSRTKWNNTGHLAGSIRVERRADSYAVTAASDRLQVESIVERFVADVPEVSDPVTDDVETAIERAVDAIFGPKT